MYQTQQIQIRKGNSLFEYCHKMCGLSNNLGNATRFLLRQYATAKQAFDDYKPLYKTQKEIFELVETITKDTSYHPKEESKWLTYNQIDAIFKMDENVDYYALPSQVNQQTIKLVLRDFKSYFESIKIYKKNPNAFTGRPKMPKYKKSGGLDTVIFTNQVCKVKENKYLRFPLTKKKLNIGKYGVTGELKEVRIHPTIWGFSIEIVSEANYDNEIVPDDTHNEKLLTTYKELTTLNERALAIDPGLSNLCAVVNNFGAEPLLIKGTILKSINQYYNKMMSEYRSIAKTVNGLDWTNRMTSLTRKRNNMMKDLMHKTTAYLVEYVKQNHVKIVVIGHNIFQKQEINIGETNNQNFVSIPMCMLISQLQYKLNRIGVELVITEESYTSQASFENMDFLPTYGVDDEKANFSGTRKNRLYQTDGKKAINADLNGAANIFRKVFPKVTDWNICLNKQPTVVLVRQMNELSKQ